MVLSYFDLIKKIKLKKKKKKKKKKERNANISCVALFFFKFVFKQNSLRSELISDNKRVLDFE